MPICVTGAGTLRSLAENLWVWRGRPVTTSPLHVIVVILQDGWKKASSSLKENIHTDLGCPSSDVSSVCALPCATQLGIGAAASREGPTIGTRSGIATILDLFTCRCPLRRIRHVRIVVACHAHRLLLTSFQMGCLKERRRPNGRTEYGRQPETPAPTFHRNLNCFTVTLPLPRHGVRLSLLYLLVFAPRHSLFVDPLSCALLLRCTSHFCV